MDQNPNDNQPTPQPNVTPPASDPQRREMASEESPQTNEQPAQPFDPTFSNSPDPQASPDQPANPVVPPVPPAEEPSGAPIPPSMATPPAPETQDITNPQMNSFNQPEQPQSASTPGENPQSAVSATEPIISEQSANPVAETQTNPGPTAQAPAPAPAQTETADAPPAAQPQGPESQPTQSNTNTSAENPGQTFGIVSIVLDFVGLALIGAILGFISRKKSKDAGKPTTLGTIGLVLGIIFTVLGAIFFTISIVSAINAANSPMMTPAPTGTTQTF